MKLLRNSALCFVTMFLVFWISDIPAVFSASSDLGTHLFAKNKITLLNAEETYQYDSISSKEYWKGYYTDLSRIVTAPGFWKSSEWMTTAAVSSITFGLYLADEDIQEAFQKNRNGTTDDISNIACDFGEPTVIFPSIILLYLYGKLDNNLRTQRTALLSLESFFFANLFTYTLKLSGRRHRPNSSDSSATWDGPGFSSSDNGGDPDGFSFPSGHTASAFAVASVVASEYDDNIVVPVFVYGASILTALSRVNDNEHWASDVFGGAAIGYFTGKAIVCSRKNTEKKTFQVIPTIDSTHIGLMMHCRF